MAARALTMAAAPPAAMPVRGPHWSLTQPMTGAPTGVVPRRNIM